MKLRRTSQRYCLLLREVDAEHAHVTQVLFHQFGWIITADINKNNVRFTQQEASANGAFKHMTEIQK